MNVKKFASGDVIFNEGERSHQLAIVAEGVVSLALHSSVGTAEKGCLLGVPESNYVVFPYTCTAKGDVTLYQYDYQSYEDLNTVLTANQDACGLIAYCYTQMIGEQVAAYRSILASCQILLDTVCDQYSVYQQMCAELKKKPKELPGIDQLRDFYAKAEIQDWAIEYYNAIGSFSPTKWKAFYEKDIAAVSGFLIRAGVDYKALSATITALRTHLDMICDLIVSDYRIDLFTFYMELFEEAIVYKIPYAPICDAIERIIETVESTVAIDADLARERFREYRNLIPKQSAAETINLSENGLDENAAEAILSEIRDSLDTILAYSGLEADAVNDFKQLIKKYAQSSDRSSSDDTMRKLRKSLTIAFYEIYRMAFLRSITDENVPTILMMFFMFGYVDASLCGENNALTLYLACRNHQPDSSGHVFTFYEWLKLIYNNKKENCVNEFNEDYADYLRKLKSNKKITEAEEAAALRNGKKRVNYEIDNMFRSVNKMVSGHILTYCPIFSDHEIYRPIQSTLLTADVVKQGLSSILEIDFSLFYREMTFAAPEVGIQKEVIEVEVFPDIILMPGHGVRGAMWQEITGKKRTTPARFALPILLTEDLDKVLAHICGEFRWELCRRIQGVHWNDLGERSLTSDYCDYLETYRRSRELSPETKEKIKSQYSKCRNNSKEMFSKDYSDYILYEAGGSMRLNKLTRAILFKYCPLSKTYRMKMTGNQVFSDMIDKFRQKRAHTIKLADIVVQRIEKAGHKVPAPILEYRKYLEK